MSWGVNECIHTLYVEFSKNFEIKNYDKYLQSN